VIGAVFRLTPGHKQVIRSLAVLPFRNLGDGDGRRLPCRRHDRRRDHRACQTWRLQSDLRNFGRAIQGHQENLSPTLPAYSEWMASWRELYSREGNQVRITVQLIGADADRHLWAESYQRQMTDILALQDEVALGVAHAIKLELSPGAVSRPASPKPVNTEAYEAYLKGSYFAQKRDESYIRAKDYFQHAIQLDPNYAPAYAGLSDFYVLSDDLPPAESAAQGEGVRATGVAARS